MPMNWKVVAPILVIVLVALGLLMWGSEEPAVTPSTNTPEITPAATVPQEEVSRLQAAPATGNVDDLVASLGSEADGDLALLADGNDDVALVTSDSTEINGVASSYDETSF